MKNEYCIMHWRPHANHIKTRAKPRKYTLTFFIPGMPPKFSLQFTPWIPLVNPFSKEVEAKWVRHMLAQIGSIINCLRLGWFAKGVRGVKKSIAGTSKFLYLDPSALLVVNSLANLWTGFFETIDQCSQNKTKKPF